MIPLRDDDGRVSCKVDGTATGMSPVVKRGVCSTMSTDVCSLPGGSALEGSAFAVGGPPDCIGCFAVTPPERAISPEDIDKVEGLSPII